MYNFQIVITIYLKFLFCFLFCLPAYRDGPMEIIRLTLKYLFIHTYILYLRFQSF